MIFFFLMPLKNFENGEKLKLYDIHNIDDVKYIDSRYDYDYDFCNFTYNYHHLTPNDAIKYYDKYMSKELNTTNINYKNFLNVVNYENFDFYKSTNGHFIYNDILGRRYQGDSSILNVYENKDSKIKYNNDSFGSVYHKTYIGSHTSSNLININSITDKNLLVVGDSMFIPFVPILSTIFRNVFYIDNRKNYNIKIKDIFDYKIIISWYYCDKFDDPGDDIMIYNRLKKLF